MSVLPYPSILAVALLATLATSGCTREEAPPPAAEATPTPESVSPAIATPTPAPASGPGAIARISGADDNPATGDLSFVAQANGDVHVTGSLAGLAPDSDHGFHVHDTGDCSNPAGGSAGTHFNPAAQPHGGPEAATRHAGDMPNIHADASGSAMVDVTLAGVGFGTRDDRDLVGRAVVVHEKSDDYATQPSGGSGTPIACGVIELPAEASPPPA